MRTYLTAVGMIAVTALIIFAGHARAEPPPTGWTGSYLSHDRSHLQPIIVCKKAEDVKGIFATAKASGFEEAGHQAVMLYSNGEECKIATIEHVTILNQEYLGEAHDDLKGQVAKVWDIEILSQQGKWHCFFEEISKDTPA